MKIEVSDKLINVSLDAVLSHNKNYGITQLNIPILGINKDYTFDDIVEIEIMLDRHDKKKGWLYSKVNKVAFKIKGKYYLASRRELQKMVEEKCKEKVFSKEPEPWKLMSDGERIVTFIKPEDLPI